MVNDLSGPKICAKTRVYPCSRIYVAKTAGREIRKNDELYNPIITKTKLVGGGWLLPCIDYENAIVMQTG